MSCAMAEVFGFCSKLVVVLVLFSAVELSRIALNSGYPKSLGASKSLHTPQFIMGYMENKLNFSGFLRCL
jgi:hypothetical protein